MAPENEFFSYAFFCDMPSGYVLRAGVECSVSVVSSAGCPRSEWFPQFKRLIGPPKGPASGAERKWKSVDPVVRARQRLRGHCPTVQLQAHLALSLKHELSWVLCCLMNLPGSAVCIVRVLGNPPPFGFLQARVATLDPGLLDWGF
jgi:hypothetical protein